MDKKLSIKEKCNLFDKMCMDNYFLLMATNSEYTEIKDLFVNDMINLDLLVSEIMFDGSTDKSRDEVKKIVYGIFSDLPIDQIELLPKVKKILEDLKELINTDPLKLLDMATYQLKVLEFIQLTKIFKELKIV